MATAAKAKVLLRELKTVKADLAFAKQRCAQLEEENKRLLERREKGNNPDDDDLVHLFRFYMYIYIYIYINVCGDKIVYIFDIVYLVAPLLICFPLAHVIYTSSVMFW